MSENQQAPMAPLPRERRIRGGTAEKVQELLRRNQAREAKRAAKAAGKEQNGEEHVRASEEGERQGSGDEQPNRKTTSTERKAWQDQRRAIEVITAKLNQLVERVDELSEELDRFAVKLTVVDEVTHEIATRQIVSGKLGSGKDHGEEKDINPGRDGDCSEQARAETVEQASTNADNIPKKRGRPPKKKLSSKNEVTPCEAVAFKPPVIMPDPKLDRLSGLRSPEAIKASKAVKLSAVSNKV